MAWRRVGVTRVGAVHGGFIAGVLPCVQGGWVLLQNCHLGLDFMEELLNILTETESMDASSRVWITTEEHPKFPISLLQVPRPPQRHTANLRDTLPTMLPLPPPRPPSSSPTSRPRA